MGKYPRLNAELCVLIKAKKNLATRGSYLHVVKCHLDAEEAPILFRLHEYDGKVGSQQEGAYSLLRLI